MVQISGMLYPNKSVTKLAKTKNNKIIELFIQENERAMHMVCLFALRIQSINTMFFLVNGEIK